MAIAISSLARNACAKALIFQPNSTMPTRPVRISPRWPALLAIIGMMLFLSGCGTTWQGMLSGGLKGTQEHELRQRPLHTNGLY